MIRRFKFDPSDVRIRLESITVGLLTSLFLGIILDIWREPLFFVRPFLGVILLTFIPGALLTRLLSLENDSFGRFILFSSGLSFTLLTIIVVLNSLVLPLFGVGAPLSFIPLSASIITTTALLLLLDYRSGSANRSLYLPPIDSSAILFFLTLPATAVVAAVLMNQYDSNVGSFAFITLVTCFVIISSTRYLPSKLYPAILFFISISILLHRNLITNHVIGVDIQFTYFISKDILAAHSWQPARKTFSSAIPLVTAVPTTFTVIAGLKLSTVFKVVYVMLFSFVPVGVFYVAREMFDDTVALFGGLFFQFYHISFFFTPGKQLVSELFVVLLLQMFIRKGTKGIRQKSAIFFLYIGLVCSHYGMSYVFGISLLVASIMLYSVKKTIGETEDDLSPTSPLFLLLIATAWYSYAAPDFISELIYIPLDMVNQLFQLSSGNVPGSGASYVQEERSFLQNVSFYIYLLLTCLLAIGLMRRIVDIGLGIWRGNNPKGVVHTAIAVPLFVFLGLSYFVIANLWADRAYQMVLPVLAPFAIFGYAFIFEKAKPILLWNPPKWSLISVFLSLLLLFNSGFVFSLAGTSSDYTFDSDAHTYAYNDAELAALIWLANHSDIQRQNQTENRPQAETVSLHTDETTQIMIWSIVPPSHYNVEVVSFKNIYRKKFNEDNITDGYILIRDSSVIKGRNNGRIPLDHITKRNLTEVERQNELIYANGDIRIYKAKNSSSVQSNSPS
jgi:uncharacterized membrane protein